MRADLEGLTLRSDGGGEVFDSPCRQALRLQWLKASDALVPKATDYVSRQPKL